MGPWFRRASLVAALAALTGACGRSSSTSVTAPSARCGVNASAQPASVAAPGGSGAIVVATNRECAWEARSEVDWLSLSSASGQGDGTRQLRRGAPTRRSSSGAARSSSTPSASRSPRAPAPCVFTLDRLERSVDADGGRHDVAVSAQAGCAWTAVSHAPWITVVAGAPSQGAGVVTRAGPEERAPPTAAPAPLTIAGQTYTVEQASASRPDSADRSRLHVRGRSADRPVRLGGRRRARSWSRRRRGPARWAAVASVPWITVEGGAADRIRPAALRRRAQHRPGPRRHGDRRRRRRHREPGRAGRAADGALHVHRSRRSPRRSPPRAAPAKSPSPPPRRRARGRRSRRWRGSRSRARRAAPAPAACASPSRPTPPPSARSGALVVAGSTVAISQARRAADAAAATAAADPAPSRSRRPPRRSRRRRHRRGRRHGLRADLRVDGDRAPRRGSRSRGRPAAPARAGSPTPSPARPRPPSGSGTLTVAGFTVTVTQAAAPVQPPPCTFTVAPDAAIVPRRPAARARSS